MTGLRSGRREHGCVESFIDRAADAWSGISFSIYLLQAMIKDFVLSSLDKVDITSKAVGTGLIITVLVISSLAASKLIEE
jgi:peptidoglycan/LPS O-acetylase OafA/YrhL